MINVGDKAPQFVLPAHDGRTINSQDYYGLQPVVLFFYPKANTGG